MRAAWRPATWLVLPTLVAGLLAGPAAAGQQGPASSATADPATAELALSRQRAERVAQLDGLSRNHPAPFVASPAADDPTIVLPPRPAPWTIAEIRALFPAAFSTGGPSTLLLGQSLFVARGARLQVRGREVRRLRLLSTPERFVSLTGWRATIELSGSRLHPLTVSSWDPGRGGPDPRPEDGRAFILARGSSMTAMTAGFSHLGFGDGRTSGVAWAGLAAVAGRGIAETPATGAVTNSTFQGNRIGAFSDLAPDMTWTRNRFLANQGHGFNAHSGCRALILDGNTASGNRGDGFLLARGCRDNLLQGNHAVGNAAGGIVLGNGSATSAGATDNTVISNTATDNAAGLVVDGGTGNRLRGNTVQGGTTGIEIRNSRANPVEGNTVRDVKGPGVDLDGGAGNQVTGNRIERSHVGLYLKRATAGGVISKNQILASAQFGIYLSEGAGGNRASGNFIKGAFSGIRAKDARGNRIAGNTILEATDSGISLHGDVRNTLVLDNLVSGRGGHSPIEQLSSTAGLAGVRVEANRIDGWEVARPALAPLDRLRHFLRFHPTALLWLLVLAVPVLVLPLRLWHRRRVRRWYKSATTGRTDA